MTGAGGFVGQRLCGALEREIDDLRVIRAGYGDGLSLQMDITDAGAVEAVIAREPPDALVHLAAISAVGAAAGHPSQAWAVNYGGTQHILQALETHAPACHLLFISSAEVYGASFASGMALSEDAPLQPLNDYAASKAAGEGLVREAVGRGLFATIARPFNHTGPGQSADFVIPSFAAQIAASERGLREPAVHAGNLDDERNFMHVDDTVAAYIDIVRRAKALANGLVLNIAADKSYRIGDLLDRLRAMSAVPIRVEIDLARVRTGGIKTVAGDSSRAHTLLGWRPTISMDRTLEEVLNYQRDLLRNS